MNAIKQEKNITLYASCRAFDVETKDSRITKVFIRNIETNQEMVLTAPLFADCTGDANLGFMASAEYRSGREARSEYNEPTAPVQADKMTMGASYNGIQKKIHRVRFSLILIMVWNLMKRVPKR